MAYDVVAVELEVRRPEPTLGDRDDAPRRLFIGDDVARFDPFCLLDVHDLPHLGPIGCLPRSQYATKVRAPSQVATTAARRERTRSRSSPRSAGQPATAECRAPV